MLHSTLFRVMNTSIMGTPCDIGFNWKDGALEKLCLGAPKSLIWHCLNMVVALPMCPENVSFSARFTPEGGSQHGVRSIQSCS